jgi:hypothetical protein
MRLLADAALRVAARQCEAAALDPQQARDHAKERGFARAVAAGHGQSLSRRERECEAGKDLASAPPAEQIVRPQRQRISHRRGIRARQAVEKNAITPGACRSFSFMWNA